MVIAGAAPVNAGEGEPVEFIRTNDPRVVVEPLFDGVSFVTNLTFSPDGRLFLLEKNTGFVRTFDLEERKLSSSVIRIQPLHLGFEAGAIGMAFAPDYDPQTGGRVYVSHVISDATWRISYFEEDGRGRGRNLTKLMDFPDCLPGLGMFDTSAHNIENIHFGPNPVAATPEEVLYVSFGDGGIPHPGEEWVDHPSQSDQNWCGGIYFLDPLNPPTLEEAPSHLFARGIRNAFDFTFHPLSGALYLTENSYQVSDEVNRAAFGDNLGWNGWNASTGILNDPQFVDPLFTRYQPTFSPTGICVYMGDQLPPKYRNQVLFGTYNQGEIYLLRLKDPSDPNSEVRSVEKILGMKSETSRPLGTAGGIIDLAPGPDGWIYLCTGGDPFGTSALFRLRKDPESPPFHGLRVY